MSSEDTQHTHNKLHFSSKNQIESSVNILYLHRQVVRSCAFAFTQIHTWVCKKLPQCSHTWCHNDETSTLQFSFSSAWLHGVTLFNLLNLVWFYTCHQYSFSYVGTGLPGLNQTTKSCSKTQRSDACEAQTSYIITKLKLNSQLHFS